MVVLLETDRVRSVFDEREKERFMFAQQSSLNLMEQTGVM